MHVLAYIDVGIFYWIKCMVRLLIKEYRWGQRCSPKFPRNLYGLGSNENQLNKGDTAKPTRRVDPMMFKRWPNAYGVCPALKHHWVNSSCLLGGRRHFEHVTRYLMLDGPHTSLYMTAGCQDLSCRLGILSLSSQHLNRLVIYPQKIN